MGRGTSEAVAAVLERTRDADAGVRAYACKVLARSPKGSPVATDALAARLRDEDETVRVTAAVELARRGDGRGGEVLGGLGPVDPNAPYYWELRYLP
ncbi:hypothetical protein AC230_09465 [Streptomyces caatingaensis]|uniref:HEAT repeat domain-containing protein n=1 Tax=Streptomyces caatingaensis TaxID=1678637 RepID=A0A0K9XHH9_9ACTN|nr:hypothetical protein AC230_09465 [Streptomyces caatingaensis]